jgi:hypothetical protein
MCKFHTIFKQLFATTIATAWMLLSCCNVTLNFMQSIIALCNDTIRHAITTNLKLNCSQPKFVLILVSYVYCLWNMYDTFNDMQLIISSQVCTHIN